MWGWRSARFSFELPETVRASALTCLSYWEVQRFECSPARDGGFVGRRGSLWGNLTAFDVRRLRCQLEVTAVEQQITCSIVVDTSFQYISEWTEAEVVLELLMFRRTLLALPAPAVLDQFRSETHAATRRMVLSALLFGKELPARWKDLLQELAAPYPTPVLEDAVRRGESLKTTW